MIYNVHDTWTFKMIGQVDALDDQQAINKAKKKFRQIAPLVQSKAVADKPRVYDECSSFAH